MICEFVAGLAGAVEVALLVNAVLGGIAVVSPLGTLIDVPAGLAIAHEALLALALVRARQVDTKGIGIAL